MTRRCSYIFTQLWRYRKKEVSRKTVHAITCKCTPGVEDPEASEQHRYLSTHDEEHLNQMWSLLYAASKGVKCYGGGTCHWQEMASSLSVFTPLALRCGFIRVQLGKPLTHTPHRALSLWHVLEGTTFLNKSLEWKILAVKCDLSVFI